MAFSLVVEVALGKRFAIIILMTFGTNIEKPFSNPTHAWRDLACGTQNSCCQAPLISVVARSLNGTSMSIDNYIVTAMCISWMV